MPLGSIIGYLGIPEITKIEKIVHRSLDVPFTILKTNVWSEMTHSSRKNAHAKGKSNLLSTHQSLTRKLTRGNVKWKLNVKPTFYRRSLPKTST